MDEPRDEIWSVEEQAEGADGWLYVESFPTEQAAKAFAKAAAGVEKKQGYATKYRPIRYIPAESAREALVTAKRAIEAAFRIDHVPGGEDALRLIEAQLKEQE